MKKRWDYVDFKQSIYAGCLGPQMDNMPTLGLRLIKGLRANGNFP
jgi:hypothetical protein